MKNQASTTNFTTWSLIAIGAVTIMGFILASCGGGGGGDTPTSVGVTPTSTVQLVACPGTGTADVTIQDFSFSPQSITAAVNSIVKWTNNGPSTHTVTGTTVPANGAFDSSHVSAGTSVCFKFTAAGTYNYHCSIHPSLMTGSVTIQ